MFRWCTNRLKIKTSTRFIKEKISKTGEVVIVLGTRKQESDSRAAVMKKMEIKDNIFSRSNQFSRSNKFSAAFTYTPIEVFNGSDSFTYGG